MDIFIALKYILIYFIFFSILFNKLEICHSQSFCDEWTLFTNTNKIQNKKRYTKKNNIPFGIRRKTEP